MNDSRDADELVRIAALAAREIMRVYAGEFAVEYKGYQDPVTAADKAANALIVEALESSFPGVPIVAEESDVSAYGDFENAEAAFFVDPLDGTREFVARNGEFAVMIGLARGGRASLGVLHCPALGRIFVGGDRVPAREIAGDGSARPLHVTGTTNPSDAVVLVSRSRPMPALREAAAKAGLTKFLQPGSAGLKGAMIAAGEGDVFAHVGVAGSRWDSCAPEAVVAAAGGIFTDGAGDAIDYRKKDLVNRRGILAANPILHRALVPLLSPILSDA